MDPVETKPQVAVKEESGQNETASVETRPEAASYLDDHVSDEEEDVLAPATICNKRESRAPQVDVNQVNSEPDFAAVCSFFNKFGFQIGLKPMPFTKLELILTTFDDQGRVNKELLDLHLTLMRRLRISSVRAETWENYLRRFLEPFSSMENELLQLERYGYVHLPVTSKIRILKALCEAQFDSNPKLRESILASCKPNDIRLIPVGMDKRGLAYWFQQDSEFNVRIYTEEPDDLSGASWTLIVRTPDELDSLISRLKSEDLGYVKKEKDEKEKPIPPPVDGMMVISNKKATFIDLCYDEAMIKKMKENLLKKKDEKNSKKEAKVKEESEHEDEEDAVPEEIELDRRLMPRRSAASRAVTNIKKFVTPTKRSPRKPRAEKSDIKEDSEAEPEKEEKAASEEGSSGDSEDNEDDFESLEESEEDEDDEFKPKSEKKRKGKKRRLPKKKKTIEDEEDDDESEDEEVPKERKQATGDAACGQCKKSTDWEVLLLCDSCDDAWHTYCLKPMLWFVPDGDWFCPKCVHGMLIEKLEEVATGLIEHLKKKSVEDKRKMAAAERLKREMEYIGVSLNNIIPSSMGLKESAIASSSSSDEDDGQRRCKRKAVKRIAPKSRFQMEVIKTIAEGRSRRRTTRVDYNFSEYDNAIQDACVELGDKGRPASREGEVVRPTGGAGRGKDMANIIEAEEKRRGSVDEDGESAPPERNVGRPAVGSSKPKRRLNDLNIDNQEDSDSEEYEADSEEVEAAAKEEALSGSDYVPSEEERRVRRSGRTGPRGPLGPTQSDEEFVVSGSDESDFGYRGRKKRKIEIKKKSKKKRGRWDPSESETEEESDAYSAGSDSSSDKKKKRNAKKKGRWAAKAVSDVEDEEEYEEVEPEEEDEDVPRTNTGRPLRRAVVVQKKDKNSGEDDLEDEEEEDEEDDNEKESKKEKRPVGALDRPRKKRISGSSSDDSEDEFKPTEEEVDEQEDEDEDEEEEVPPVATKLPLKKRKIVSDDEGSDSQPPPAKKPTSDPVTNTTVKRPRSSDEDKESEASVKKTIKTEPLPEKVEQQKERKLNDQPPPPLANVKREPEPQIIKPIVVEEDKITAMIPSVSSPVVSMPQYAAPSRAGFAPPPPVSSAAYPMPHNPYYQGGPPTMGAYPPMMMMPGRPPVAPYPSPYSAPGMHAPPTSPWGVAPMPGYTPQGLPPNPYAPVHNPYGQPGQSPSSGKNLNDLQSL